MFGIIHSFINYVRIGQNTILLLQRGELIGEVGLIDKWRKREITVYGKQFLAPIIRQFGNLPVAMLPSVKLL